MTPQEALAQALDNDEFRLGDGRGGQAGTAFLTEYAGAILGALPRNVHLVVHEHDIEDEDNCSECSDARWAGRRGAVE